MPRPAHQNSKEPGFAKPTSQADFSQDVKAIVRRLLTESLSPRDALPYTAEFDTLKECFRDRTGHGLSDAEFWRMLWQVGKRGGIGRPEGRRRAPRTPSLTREQQLELLRLFPEGIGERDNLPYTRRFDELHRQFSKLTRTRLSKHEFWRAVDRVAKRSKKPRPIFERAPLGGLPKALVQALERFNPWWRGQPGKPTPPYRRWAFREALRRLDSKVAPVVAIRGPRQVGKSTIQEQIVEELLRVRGIAPRRILRVQFDETPALGPLKNPIETVVRWFEDNVLAESVNAAAQRGEDVYLLFDELQNLPRWSAQLKSLVDHVSARTLVTGSSALRIARGRDNLAGRMTTIELGPLRVYEIAGMRSLGSLPTFASEKALEEWTSREFWRGLCAHAARHKKVLYEAFGQFSRLGGYPICHKEPNGDPALLSTQVVGDVVTKTIEHDPRSYGRRGPIDVALVRESFRLVCRYAGQSVSYQELARQLSQVLGVGVKHHQVQEAVQFLADTMLIHQVPPLELLQKKQARPPKLCLCDHFVRNAWLREIVPLAPDELAQASEPVATMAGHIIESVVGYYLMGIPGLEVAWFPKRAREPEVDYVLTLGLKRLPIEVKYQSGQPNPHDCRGVNAFCGREHYGAGFGLVLTQKESGRLNDQVIAVPAAAFMLVV